MQDLNWSRISKSPSAVEEASSTHQLFWYGQRDVALYQIFGDNARHEGIDDFVNRVLKMIEEWPPEKPYLVIYHLQRLNWSPYIRSRAQEAFDAVPTTMRGRMATVLPKGAMGQIVKLFMRGQRHQPLEVQTFLDMDEAVKWVEALIPVQSKDEEA